MFLIAIGMVLTLASVRTLVGSIYGSERVPSPLIGALFLVSGLVLVVIGLRRQRL